MLMEMKVSTPGASSREILVPVECWAEASPSEDPGAGLDFEGIQLRCSELGAFFAIPCGELKNEISLNFLPGICDWQPSLTTVYWIPVPGIQQ